MKVLHISTFDTGGAFNAAYRLHLSLKKEDNIESKFLVLRKYGNSGLDVYSYLEERSLILKIRDSIKARIYRLLHILKLRNKPKLQFSFEYSPFDITFLNLCQEADIINLHWIAGFVDYSGFFGKINKPIVWTLHDRNPFSGGFHFKIYENSFYNKLNQKIIKKKVAIFKKTQNLIIISPSEWLLNESKSSGVFTQFAHFHIPYGIDTEVFRPYDKLSTRKKMGIPPDKIIIFFVADTLHDKRKGINLLINAIQKISHPKIVLMITGTGNIENNSIPVIDLGYLKNQNEIAQAYSSADLFVIPSLEDNLPNTILESMSCGTPVLGFEIGGIKEIINDGVTGFLVKHTNANELSSKLTEALQSQINLIKMGIKAREEILKNYNLKKQSQMYLEIYEKFYLK